MTQLELGKYRRAPYTYADVFPGLAQIAAGEASSSIESPAPAKPRRQTPLEIEAVCLQYLAALAS